MKKANRPYVKSELVTPAEQEKIGAIYKDVRNMIDLRNATYRQFNDRTLKSYLDDSDKRLNAYVPTRADKEEWQANVALSTIRDKVKRILSGYSLTVPDLKVTAGRITGELDVASIDRGEIGQKLIRASYLENENPVVENFWEAWEMAAHGTCVKYEGYLNTTFKQKFIKSYNPTTGIVEEDEREVTVDDKCISYLVPLTEFFISDFYIDDVQDQRSVAWITYRSPEQFKYEFRKYKNVDKVKTVGGLNENIHSFYQDDWGKTDRAGKSKIEIIRYYNKLEDRYVIVANGVILADTPLLWQFNGKKMYPFAKTILEPFSDKHFFYGKSFPDIMTGQYDLLNAYFNSVMDKGFKSLNPPTLIGRVNQDAFDLEDEILTTDTKIYVDDINQVKPMPIEQVSQADVAMIELLARGIEDSVPSMPHLMQGKDATAREVVITEERMQELRNIYHEMLVDLWRQKYQLRLANIMLSYPVQKTIYRDGKTEKIYKTFVIENTYLDKDTKERGILAVQFRKLTKTEKRKAELDMAAEKEAMKKKGINYRKIILDPSFFDGFQYKMSVIPESLHRTSMARLQATVLEELATVATYFPQVFIANQKEYFEDVAKAYGRDPQKMTEQAEAMAQQGAPQGIPQESAMEQPPTELTQMTR